MDELIFLLGGCYALLRSWRFVRSLISDSVGR